MKRFMIAVTFVACGTDARRERPGTEPILELAASPATSRRGIGDTSGYVGVLAPRSSAEVVAPFTSTVVEIRVKLGEQVERGQTLGRLDDRPLREQLAIAQAALKVTRAEAAQADIDHRAAINVLDRERQAYKDKIVAMAQVNAAEFNERKAAMAVTRGAASVEEQRAKIAQLEARLDDTTLLAPLAGRIALSYVVPGEHVQEGQPVIRVISSNELFVKFAISADKVGTLTPGAVVDVVLEPGGEKVRAVVRHVAPELDPVAQMILADADLVEPPPQLQSGMVCRILPRS